MYTNKQQYQPRTRSEAESNASRRNQRSNGGAFEPRNDRDRVATPLPTLTAYVVKDAGRDGEKSEWTRVGKLFAHADRRGFNLLLDKAIEGKLVIREDRPRKDAH